TLALSIPASLFLLRLFLIQHDCGHQALFKTSQTNDWIGRGIGILTMTPYDVWRRSHAIHHACSGNLDRRGTGDIMTLTVEEYRRLPWWLKLRYYLYRHPAVMFGVGPAYVFLLAHRWPMGQMRNGLTPWVSTMGTNAAIALAFGVMIYLIGLGTFLLIHLPIVLLAATIGVWLFYVQHQFEDTTWEEARHWSQEEAALYGSSYYDLPPLLSWFTANIGIHHVHHLYSRIPFYRLPEVLRDHPQLANMRRITTMEGVKTLRLKLWDADGKRLVTFSEARRLAAPAQQPALMAAE
ncbi:MAG: fatty acid desaturase, partial [Hyphomicrobiaceae bacterium]|nr:fatty acid desaturase [Hyphomicrobiaceae bacterium]